MKPDNSKFWDKIEIRCGNDPVFLDPDVDPYDELNFMQSKQVGFLQLLNH